MKINKTVLGFLIAPLIPLLGLMLVLMFPDFDLQLAFIILVSGAPLAYASALIIGIPLLYIFRKLNFLNWYHFFIGGIICSMLVGVIHYILSFGFDITIPDLSTFIICGALGAVGGIVFWLIAIRGKNNVAPTFFGQMIGLASVVGLTAFGSYMYYLGFQVKHEPAKILGQNMEYVSSIDRVVKIELSDGSQVEASLPRGVKFRSGCPIYVTNSRHFFSLKRSYKVGGYTDITMAMNISKSKRDQVISKTCN